MKKSLYIKMINGILLLFLSAVMILTVTAASYVDIARGVYYGVETQNATEPQTSAGFQIDHTTDQLMFHSVGSSERAAAPVFLPAYSNIEINDLFDGGVGTSGNPYIVSESEQLAWLAELVNSGNTTYNDKHYILSADIDLSDYGIHFNGGKGWTPIGTSKNPFDGHIDGSGHTVTGLYINDDAIISAGLFGVVDGGTVLNLDVLDANINGKYNIGSIAGSVYDGSVTNCLVTGTVAGRYNVGGVAGYISGNVSLMKCHFEGAVSGGVITGGVAGGVFGRVTDCHAISTVSGSDIAGGVAGYVYTGGNVTNCDAAGEVSGYLRIGGVAGRVGGSIINCTATGKVSGDDYVGVVAGQIDKSGNVVNCAAADPSADGDN